MKKLLTLALALTLCLTLNINAFAAEDIYVFDEAQKITSASEEVINSQGKEIEEATGIVVAYLVSDYSGNELAKHTRLFYTDNFGNKDGILLCETETQWFMYEAGAADEIFNDKDIENMWAACSAAQFYNEGAEAYMNKALEIMGKKGVSRNEDTQQDSTYENHPERVADKADLLSEAEEEALLTKLDSISQKNMFDVAVVTVKSLEGKDVQAYADDYYDYNGYGMGSGFDGILLLVGADERQSAMSTYGFGLSAFTVAGMDYIWDLIIPYMSEGDYAAAFDEFAVQCEDYIKKAKTGEPYDTGNMPDDVEMTFSSAIRVLLASMLFGEIVGFPAMRRKKKKLINTVKKQEDAADYRSGMEITAQYDNCIYSRTYRIEKKEQKSSGGSGSGAHVSSSGRTHGGSSRGF